MGCDVGEPAVSQSFLPEPDPEIGIEKGSSAALPGHGKRLKAPKARE